MKLPRRDEITKQLTVYTSAGIALLGAMLVTLTCVSEGVAATTGALTQLAGTAGCVNEGGSDGCAVGKGLLQANSVTVSPDGKDVYVASYQSSAVAVFARQ